MSEQGRCWYATVDQWGFVCQQCGQYYNHDEHHVCNPNVVRIISGPPALTDLTYEEWATRAEETARLALAQAEEARRRAHQAERERDEAVARLSESEQARGRLEARVEALRIIEQAARQIIAWFDRIRERNGVKQVGTLDMRLLDTIRTALSPTYCDGCQREPCPDRGTVTSCTDYKAALAGQEV